MPIEIGYLQIPNWPGREGPAFFFWGRPSSFDQSRISMKLEVKDFQFAECSA
jgi:hypothetical protein